MVWNYEENSVQQFQMGAFRFLSASADATVYLHCEVEACRKGDSESRCAKGCEDDGSRKRRSLVLDALAKQSVTIGPVRATKRAKVEQGEMYVLNSQVLPIFRRPFQSEVVFAFWNERAREHSSSIGITSIVSSFTFASQAKCKIYKNLAVVHASEFCLYPRFQSEA